MVQFSQLLLLASIIASCSCITSFIRLRHQPQPEYQAEPEDVPYLSGKFSNKFPNNFMEKLIASLIPEELEKLRRVTKVTEDIDVREGDTDKKPCQSHKRTDFNVEVTAVKDNRMYWVVSSTQEKLQGHEFYACNVTTPNCDKGCVPETPMRGYTYKCEQQYGIMKKTIIPVPVALLDYKDGELYYKGKLYQNYTTIEEDVWVRKDCGCKRNDFKFPNRR